MKGPASQWTQEPASCPHAEGKRTQNEHGVFLECLMCGQRWRRMTECCNTWLEIGRRTFPGGPAPSATDFKNKHARACRGSQLPAQQPSASSMAAASEPRRRRRTSANAQTSPTT
eukprot:3914945-Amphidinium_carterae.1